MVCRDRHAFLELDNFMEKLPQKRFKIEICVIKNPKTKKNRVKIAFYNEKLCLNECVEPYKVYKGKMSKKRPDFF